VGPALEDGNTAAYLRKEGCLSDTAGADRPGRQMDVN
jgi:hypothetical protein